MNRVLCIAIFIIALPLSALPQTMGRGDLSNAIVSAIEFHNALTVERDLRYNLNGKLRYNSVCISAHNFLNKKEQNCLLKELNSNKLGLIFYKNIEEYARRTNKKEFSSWDISFSEIDSNRLRISIGEVHYNQNNEYYKAAISDKVHIICEKSGYSNNWIFAHPFFIYDMCSEYRKTDYSKLTRQLYKILLDGGVKTEAHYISLFNYLRKEDKSEYHSLIKEQLNSIIENNPNVKEKIELYFKLFADARIVDEDTRIIEENFRKITENKQSQLQ